MKSPSVRLLPAAAVACLLACQVQVTVPDEADISCGASDPCPSALVCVEDIGRCRKLGSSCVDAAGGGYQSAVPGTVCTLESGAKGICLRAECVASRCGDGIVDTQVAAEQCDLGEANSDTAPDGCRSDCRPARCGDGVVDPGRGEACDLGEGNADGAACSPSCSKGCGDGFLQPGEVCDDGNLLDGDGCDGTCTPTGCGNGELTAGEECDDGNLVSGDDCDANCKPTGCGNGLVTAGESCDDGDLVSGDGCDANCRPTGCGNGVVSAGEECDDGNLVSGDDCDANCRPTGCGNGLVTAGEECDDGDLVSGDGCDANCRPTGCGNGVTTAGEECDDGNLASGDGCDGNCKPTGCGNGVVSAGEACDDGDLISGNGCDANCTPTGCGNGVVTAGEVCDDGNIVSGDRCRSDCRSDETCGNGLLDVEAAVPEQCDRGAENSDLADALCRTDCTLRRCGDGIADPHGDEQCDGADLAGATCEGLGMHPDDPADPLACDPVTCRLLTSKCRGRCGDGVIDPGFEVCDGRDFGTTSCTDSGYYGGQLTCADGCGRITTGLCAGYCGDGVASGGEECDGLDHRGLDCTNFGNDGGALLCGADCRFGTEMCLAGGDWKAVPSGLSGTSGDFFGVWANGPEDVWAVGRTGLIRHWDGGAWTDVRVGSNAYYAIIQVSPNRAFAAGESGAMAEWNGQSWAAVSSGSSYRLNAFWAAGPNDVYAVGAVGTIVHFDGTSWRAMSSPTTNELQGVWGLPSGRIFAVGNWGTVLEFDGTSWAASASFPSIGNVTLTSVWARSASDIWIVGWSSRAFHFDGTSWTDVAGGAFGNLESVFGVGDEVLVVGTYGRMLKCEPSGCRQIQCPATSTLYAIHASSASDVWAVGLAGGVVHRGGSGWVSEAFGSPVSLMALWASGPNDVYALTAPGSGASYRYDGTGWSPVSGFTSSANALWGASPNAIWAAARTRSFWNGSSSTYLGYGAEILAVWGTDPTQALLVGAGGAAMRCGTTANSCVDESTGAAASLRGLWGAAGAGYWAVGDAGRVARRGVDGVWTSATVTTAGLKSVWGATADALFAVGDAGTALFGDGESWAPMSTHSTEALYDVWASSSSDVFAVGPNGTILHYDGTTWARMDAPTVFNLNSVWGTSADNVVAVGDTGTVVRLTSSMPKLYAGACGRVREIYCGATLHGTTTDAASKVSSYGCAASPLAGREVVYRLRSPTNGPVTVRLSSRSELDLIAFAGSPSACDPASCLAASQQPGGTEELVLQSTRGATYYFAVEAAGGDGGYALEVVCPQP